MELPDGNGALVLPTRVVGSWDKDNVKLGVPLAGLKQERVYAEEDFEVCKAPVGSEVPSGSSLAWQYRYGAGVQAVPALAAYAPEAVAEEEGAALGRGAAVYSWQGPVGQLDHVLVDATSGEVTHLIIKRGPFLARSVVVPIEQVDAVGDAGVRLKGTREDLANAGAYSARPDEGIRAEVRECLLKVGCNLDTVEFEVQAGVVTLRGPVPDVRTKREAERAVRELEGVVAVHNTLTPDSALAAEITAELANDTRTELAEVGVGAEHGMVTIDGTVATAVERKAAEEVARETPGVMLVINEIVVAPQAVGGRQPTGVFVIHPAQWFLLRGGVGGGGLR